MTLLTVSSVAYQHQNMLTVTKKLQIDTEEAGIADVFLFAMLLKTASPATLIILPSQLFGNVCSSPSKLQPVSIT